MPAPFPLETLLRLHVTTEIGARTAEALRKAFGTERRLWAASESELRGVPGIGPRRARAVAAAGKSVAWKEEAALAKRHGIALLPYHDPAYPRLLASLYDPPLILSVLGTLTDAERSDAPPCVAMVGARRCSVPGRMLAGRLAGELAAAGLTVVSGLARGIDQAAHQGALDAGGRTLAVLGSGLLRPYPAEAKPLMTAIARVGAVLSEFPLTAAPLKHHFPRRNRVISGLSRGVLVVEAARDSGSLITTDWAAEQGREVMACPGRAGDPLASGVNALLRDGAALVEHAGDVCEALGLQPPQKADAPEPASPLAGPLRIVWGALGPDPVHADDLGAATGLEAGQVLSALAQLELLGRAKAAGGMHYVRTR